MKKVLALVLAAAMAFSMVACGGNKTATSGSAEGTATGSSNVTVQLGPNPETLDPALNSAIDGANLIPVSYTHLDVYKRQGY